jgi:hypothetical protein
VKPTPRTRQRRARIALSILALAYLTAIALDSSGFQVLAKRLPAPLRFFSEVACLFPHAGQFAIEYRAEGWLCREARWTEIDTRASFLIDADNKENRFQRAMHFYHNTPRVLREIDGYLAARTPGIGGVRLLSLRLPLPSPGDRSVAYAFHPLETYAPTLRRLWYETPDEERDRRCGGADP